LQSTNPVSGCTAALLRCFVWLPEKLRELNLGFAVGEE